MLYSKLIGQTKKEAPKDEESISAQLLVRAGYIEKEMAGVYAFLPLGLRVMQNIMQVIREEMDAIGGQELLLGALQNPEIWKKSGRWSEEVIDIWFRTELANGTLIGLASTHEEPLAEIMKRHINSYKDLPLYAYQFQTKFRNELRAKGGLLRTREFIMKDLYSFNTDQESMDLFYEEAIGAYHKIFSRLGIGGETFLTFADGKPFSKYSHEFQTVCETGEDVVYLSREKNLAVNKEVYNDEVLNDLKLTKGELKEVKAIEVGNIFKLGTKYAEALGLTYTDENGENRPVVMGSYGIGPARCMATIVELKHDKKGIIWPENLAPYRLHLIGLNLEESQVAAEAKKVYENLSQMGHEVLFDDRLNVSAGEKFADADLVGCPYRLVVSQKTGDKVELKMRSDNKEKLVSLSELDNLLNS
jgi:prolyl-tRNA synthetase